MAQRKVITQERGDKMNQIVSNSVLVGVVMGAIRSFCYGERAHGSGKV